MPVSVERGSRADVRRLFNETRWWVFDFDGTLVDSNPIKWAGFEAAFADMPAQREEILTYCRANHDVIRADKFRHVYEVILKQPYGAELEARLQRRFESATTARIVEAPEIRGAGEFLRRARRSRPLALLSTTPHETLLQIVRGRGWLEWFGDIRGGPVRKSEWLTELSARVGQAPSDVLVLGDTREDAQAAAEAGCRFLAVGPELQALSIEPGIIDFRDVLDLVRW